MNLLPTQVHFLLERIILKNQKLKGCDGNENNFITYDSCMNTCSNLNRNYTAEAINKSNNPNLMMYPVDCRISEWSEWSDCSGWLKKNNIKNLINYLKLANECNKIGLSVRTRSILSQPRYGGKLCPTNLNQTKICFKDCQRSLIIFN